MPQLGILGTAGEAWKGVLMGTHMVKSNKKCAKQGNLVKISEWSDCKIPLPIQSKHIQLS